MPGYDTRPINPDDLELICHHREAMFRDMGRAESALLPMTVTFREWLRPRLRVGMTCWAVSDLNTAELQQFADLFKAQKAASTRS